MGVGVGVGVGVSVILNMRCEILTPRLRPLLVLSCSRRSGVV